MKEDRQEPGATTSAESTGISSKQQQASAGAQTTIQTETENHVTHGYSQLQNQQSPQSAVSAESAESGHQQFTNSEYARKAHNIVTIVTTISATQ